MGYLNNYSSETEIRNSSIISVNNKGFISAAVSGLNMDGNTVALGGGNIITNGSYFTFVAGFYKNRGCGTKYGFVFGKECNYSVGGYGNSILGGYSKNCICGYTSRFNSIIGGIGNTMSGSTTINSVIVSGYKNMIKNSSRSLVVNGSGNYLGDSLIL
jgi:hypothetical protein